MQYFHFVHNGQRVSYSLKRNEFSGQNADLVHTVNCQHPLFVEVFHSPSVTGTSIGYIIDQGKVINHDFFTAMQRAFR